MKKQENTFTLKTTICAKVVSINSTGLVVHINGEEYQIPFLRVPWFRNAKVEDVFDLRMNGLDEIRWDTLDIDLDIESLKHPEKYPLIMKQYVLKDEPTIAAESGTKYKSTP